MPVDPQVEVLLKAMEAAGPPVEQLTPGQARESMRAAAGFGRYPDPRATTEDRDIPGPGGALPVRIYRPPAPGPLPVLVFFHGGGWVIGGTDTHDPTCHQLAVQVPAVVVSVDYRLAPEHPYPAPVEDCLAATRWVRDHAGELEVDGHRLAVGGDSAGGNLAAVVARRSRDEGDPPIAFQLLVYPATDLTCSMPSHRENGRGYFLTAEAIRWFLDHYIAEDRRHEPDASPLAADVHRLPPALVITAELDPLRDEGEAYAERLRAAGVPAATSRYDGMIHGFFSMDGILTRAVDAVEEAATALRGALHPAGS